MTFYVYALLAPGTDVIRYVGKGSNVVSRIASHSSRSGAVAVREWIASVGYPDVRILGSFADETLALLDEKKWIRELHATGQLLNTAVPSSSRSQARGRFTGVGERCLERRKALGLSQISVAKSAGILQPGLCRIESSERVGLTAESAVRIARALGCNVEWLVTGEGPMLRPLTLVTGLDQGKRNGGSGDR
jgi:hypothetical protein